jgi:hypothetical protein
MNPAKLTVDGMRQNDDEITLSQMTFSLAEFNPNGSGFVTI